ncbi:FtsK/SpoIIIE domain-containing protein [Arthrobacter sp. zg-Y750]|uniref:FtsK/SpoIIIE domain-containing protein n=1 Tax=Arthrobacter sp. zg-Y750 TaxID=2894189 RepID=UPI002F4298B9|nr:FHA domain-containing protein [Arthrobacter sp. zg-Y750]
MVIELTGAAGSHDVQARLAERYGASCFSIGGLPLHTLSPGRAPFVNGAVIVCSAGSSGPPGGRTARGTSETGTASLLMVVCSGPDAGGITPLQRGTYRIGRLGSSEARAERRIGICDPALSRDHALLVVGTDSVQVRDLGSANGTWVDGRRIREAVVDTGSVLRFGYSSCRLVLPAAVPDPEAAPADPFEPQTVQLSEHAQKTGLLLLGALLPLVLGVVLALATGMWMFLAFSALSAVTAMAGAAGARRRRREQAAAIALAAAKDARGRHLAAPDPGTMALAAVLGSTGRFISGVPAPVAAPAPAAPQGPAAEYPVRIGMAPQPANVVPSPTAQRFSAPVIPDAPVILRLGKDRDICLQGPEAGALCRTILLNAASNAAAGSALRVVCAGRPPDLEPAARFLPGVTLAALPDPGPPALPPAAALLRSHLEQAAPEAEAAVIVLCIPGAWALYAQDLAAALPGPLRARICVIRLGGGPAASTVTVSSGRGTRSDGPDTLEFIPDLVQAAGFERLSRAAALSRHAAPAAGGHADAGREDTGRIPSTAAFGEYHPSSPDKLLRGWKLPPGGAGAVVGVSAAGPVTLDLEKDGPHFLVAGTTGSGKSELLRSFVASLAAREPPSGVTFLLIDFKGGSGLAPLAGLPHSVGLLTDLSAGNVSRALTSLRAEVRRREALFAGTGADSIAAYNVRPGPAGTLPRLLVVVDEFRMLADEVPSALPELLRIAAVGRSLGLHLLLATQRPQGAVTSDIRANIATTIALRVSSAAESRDVLNSDCAAGIPSALPGRAFIARGGGQPLAFQCLSTAQHPGGSGIAVTDLAEYLLAQQEGPREPSAAAPDALQAYCSAVRRAAERGTYPSPFRPVRPPLPRTLTRELSAQAAAASAGCGASSTGTVLLGLLDDPENQNQRELSWHPGTDSHLAVLGSPRAGTSDCLQLVTSGLVAAQPGRHLYILDADGSLAWLAGAGQTGAYVGPQDTKRAARVLAFLAGEAVARMASAGGATAGGSHTSRAAEITLVVSGWARWSTAFRSGRGLAGEDDLADLVRDGERAGICVVIAGERELLNSRCFPLIPNRLFFPADASAETLLLWPRLPAMDRIIGRALVQGRIGTAEGLAAQLLGPEPHSGLPGLPDGVPPPHRIEPLPAFVAPERLTAQTGTDSVAVGLCGDELGTAAAQVPRGSVFLVAGPPGSGRTSFLRQMQRAAHPSLDIFSGNSAEDFQENLDVFLAAPGTGLVHRLLLLVDDADLLPAPVHRRLAELQSQGARLVLAAASGPQLTARVPLALQVRSAPRGALLCPASPVDGDIFGIRIDTAVRRPPGRCFLVEGTQSVEAQTAYRDE